MKELQQAIEQVQTYIQGVWLRRRYIVITAWLLCPLGWAYVYNMPPTFEAEAKLYVETSTVLEPLLRGLALRTNADDEIKIGKILYGQWLYMGIEGGLETPIFMNSRSWFTGISTFSKIQKGDTICYLSEEKFNGNTLSHPKLTNIWFQDDKIQVYKGPEWEALPDRLKTQILFTSFEISTVASIQVVVGSMIVTPARIH